MKLEPGTLIRFPYESTLSPDSNSCPYECTICTVLHTWNEIYEGENYVVVRYLHPRRGILERTYYRYEGKDTLEMKEFEVIS